MERKKHISRFGKKSAARAFAHPSSAFFRRDRNYLRASVFYCGAGPSACFISMLTGGRTTTFFRLCWPFKARVGACLSVLSGGPAPETLQAIIQPHLN